MCSMWFLLGVHVLYLVDCHRNNIIIRYLVSVCKTCACPHDITERCMKYGVNRDLVGMPGTGVVERQSTISYQIDL